MKKTITAELGCVTPYIIVPGNWSRQALEYYADECVAGLINNSAHNCTKLELFITAKEWPQRESFMAAVRSVYDARSMYEDVPVQLAVMVGAGGSFGRCVVSIDDCKFLQACSKL